jgi:hypothetical protein
MVIAWEKLRLYFNLVLLLPGLFILSSMGLSLPTLMAPALFFAVMANLCYLLGPLTELYACAITQQPELPKLRHLLFGLGLGGSLLLFILIYAGTQF